MKLSHVRIMTLMELKRIYNDKREPLLLIFGAIILCLVAGLIGDRRPQEINVTILVDHLEQPFLVFVKSIWYNFRCFIAMRSPVYP